MADVNSTKEKSDTGGSIIVLAKLIKNRGFSRGDFLIMQGSANGIILTNVAINDATVGDKGRYHKEGELFHIYNFPTSDDIAKNESRLNFPSVKGKMTASLILTEVDEVAATANTPSNDITAFLKQGIGSLLTASQNGTTCQLAPKNLAEAVKRRRSIKGGNPGQKYKQLPPNGKVITDENGKKLFTGVHVDYDEHGNMSVVTNNRGFTVDKDGNTTITGELRQNESPSEPHGLMGMPTKKNGLRDINPGTFAYPMGLGPLALNRIPDFSPINWAMKTFEVAEVIIEIAKIIDDKRKNDKRISQIVAERQAEYERERNNSVKGKIN